MTVPIASLPAPGLDDRSISDQKTYNALLELQQVLNGAVDGTNIAAAIKDAAAATASLRTLGTGAAQAAAGNDSRFSDSRAPSGTAGGDLAGTFPNPTIAAHAVTAAKTGMVFGMLNLASSATATGVPSGLTTTITPSVPIHLFALAGVTVNMGANSSASASFSGLLRMDTTGFSSAVNVGVGSAAATITISTQSGHCVGYTTLTAAAHTLDFDITAIASGGGGITTTLSAGSIVYFGFAQ